MLRIGTYDFTRYVPSLLTIFWFIRFSVLHSSPSLSSEPSNSFNCAITLIPLNLLSVPYTLSLLLFSLTVLPLISLTLLLLLISLTLLLSIQFGNSRDVPLVSLRRTTSNTTPGIGGGPRSLLYNSYNKSDFNVLITSDAEVSACCRLFVTFYI